MLGRSEFADNGSTWLPGGALSMVLSTVGVACGALVSNVIVAPLLIWVPLASPGRGMTVNSTLPSPSCWALLGGRNPASGSIGGWLVTGSMEPKDQGKTPVNGSTLPLTLTSRLRTGRRS